MDSGFKSQLVWNENISCHINQQEMSQPSVISGLQMWMRAPKTVIQKMLPTCTVSAEVRGECINKKTGYAEVHKKGMNSVSPEACIFPYIEC